MSYYKSGDYSRGGGYYRGYYAAGGGFFSKLGAGLHTVLRSPIAQAASMFVPGIPGLVLKSATALASHTNIIPDVATPGITAAPSVASMPGHSTQTMTSGGMMASHQTQMPPAGTPGHVAHAGSAGGGHRAGHRKKRRGTRRHGGGHRARRRSRSRAPRGDVRRAASGRFLTGHHAPRKHHRRGRRGGTVSFVTKDGRRVSFSPRGDYQDEAA